MDASIYREIGRQFGQYLSTPDGRAADSARLAAVLADLSGMHVELLHPFKDISLHPSFEVIARCALSGSDSIHKVAIIERLRPFYSTRVLGAFASFLDGLLGLEGVSTLSRVEADANAAMAPILEIQSPPASSQLRKHGIIALVVLVGCLAGLTTIVLRGKSLVPLSGGQISGLLSQGSSLFRPDCPGKSISKLTEMPATLLFFKSGKIRECVVKGSSQLECGGILLHGRFNAEASPEARIDEVSGIVVDDSKGQRFEYALDSGVGDSQSMAGVDWKQMFSSDCSIQYTVMSPQHFAQVGGAGDKIALGWTRRYQTFEPTSSPQ